MIPERQHHQVLGVGQAERFHWLVAPSSTVIQTSPVHTGRSEAPAVVIDHLFETMVGGPRRAASPPGRS